MYNTIPEWKMPDDEKIPHKFFVRLSIDFVFGSSPDSPGWGQYVGDLTKYYDWAKEHNIEMEHNILRYGKEIRANTFIDESKIYKITSWVQKSEDCKVMFVFMTKEDSIQFANKWQSYKGFRIGCIGGGVVHIPFMALDQLLYKEGYTMFEVWEFDKSELKSWLDDVCTGESNYRILLKCISTKRGIPVRMYFKEEADAVMFKLRWIEYEL